MADVFISYSRKDKDFVRRLDESLKSRGREAWVDWNDIRPTEEWMQAIYAAIEGADTFVFVLTPDSVASVICGREIAHAAARNKRMVPIIAREVNADTVPEALAKLNWIFCRESDDFEKATDTLITAFDTDLDWVRAHTRLLTRALEWEANKKSNSFVLRGEDLRAAEQWLAQAGTGKERQPTTLQTEYIIGSRKAAERRQRIISGAVSFGLIVSIILTIIALTQRHQAVEQKNIADQRRAEAERETRVATAQRLAAQADGALERFPQRSLLLSVEAVEVARRQNEPPVPDAEQSLRRALAAVGGRGFGGVGLPIFAFAISPDSRWLAMGGQNKAYLWDLTRSGSNVPVVLTNLEGDVTGVAFDRDGHSLVAVGPKFGVRLWDLTGTMPVPKQLSLPDQTNEKLWGRLSADNRCVLTATKDGAFALWKLTIPDPTKNPVSFPPGTPIELLDITLKVSTILMSAEGRWLAVKESGKPARLWNLADPQSPLVLHDSDGPLPEMALSPDSRWLVAAGQDHAIRLWDLTASDPSAPSRVLRGHEGDLTAIAFSADSRWLVTSGDDQTARVWDLSATDPERASIVLRGHGDMIRRVSISSDGRWLITSNIVNRLDPNRKPDTSAWLWDLSLTDAAAKPFELSGHEAGVSDAIVTSDGRWAITGSDGGSVRLWDLTSKLPSSTPLVLRGHEGGIYKLSVSADNRWLVAQGMDSSVRVWDLRTPQPATTPLVLDGGASAASPDSHWLVVGDQLLELAAPNHAVTKLILGDPERKRVPSRTAFTADSHWLVASDEFARSQLLDLTASQIAEAASILDKADGAINVLEMSPDSHWLVMSRQYQNTEARLWDLRSQNSSREPFTLRGHRKAITRAAISRDSRWLVTGSDDATLRLWNLGANDPSLTPIVLGGHAKRIWACQFSPDSLRFFSASEEGLVRMWGLESGKSDLKSTVLPGHTGYVRALYFSPDGRWLITTSGDKTTRLWDLRTPQPEASGRVFSAHEGEVSAVTFSPDSHWVATVDANHTARLWDLQAADPTAKSFDLRGHEHGVRILVISPDSRWVATTGAPESVFLDDKTVRLWNLRSKNPAASVLLLLGHERGVSSLAFSNDSQCLVSGSEDGTLRVWDLRTNNPAAAPLILSGHKGPIRELHMTADSRWIASTVKGDGTRLWLLRTTDLISAARDAAGRNLSRDEWELFFQGQPYRNTFADVPESRATE